MVRFTGAIPSSRHSTSDQANDGFRPEVAVRAIILEPVLVEVLQPLTLRSINRIVTPLNKFEISSARKAEG